MPAISRLYDFTAETGGVIKSAEVDAELDQLVGTIDALDSANLADGAVTKAKLATDALNTFLKLLVGGDHKVAFGQVAISWPGAGVLSNVVTVAHGLGASPVFFAFFMIDQAGTGACKAAGNTQTPTNITAFFETVNGFQPTAGSHGTAGWLAIA